MSLCHRLMSSYLGPRSYSPLVLGVTKTIIAQPPYLGLIAKITTTKANLVVMKTFTANWSNLITAVTAF